jgi:hypothetical protein
MEENTGTKIGSTDFPWLHNYFREVAHRGGETQDHVWQGVRRLGAT